MCYFKHFGLHLLSLLPIRFFVWAVYFQDLGLCTQSLFTVSLLTTVPTERSDQLRINCRATATVAHFCAPKSRRFRCFLNVSVNTRNTHAFTSSSQSPQADVNLLQLLWRLLHAHKALVLINSQDTRPTWCSLTVGLILQMTQRHPRLVKGLWPTRRSQSPSPPSCPLSMGSFLGPSWRPCPPSFISPSRPEWALWLVNKFSDSGGGQLQPC